MLTRRDFLRDTSLAVFALPLVPQWAARDTGAAAIQPVQVRPGLEIYPRAAWGAELPPTGSLQAEEVRFLIVHHTTGSNDYAADDVPGMLAGYYRYHTSAEKGWNDVAYNFLVDRQGRIWEGRQGSLDGPVAGDATGGNQGYTQLCCLIGDFDATLPTPEASESLTALLAWLADRYDVDTSPGATISFESRGSSMWPAGTAVDTPTIAGHRDMSSGTTCPGDAFYPYVTAELAARVHALGEPPTTTIPASTLPPETTTVPPATTTQPVTTTPPTTDAPTTVPRATAQPSTTTTKPSMAASAPESGDTGGGVSRTLLAVGSIAAAAGATAAFVKAGARHHAGEDEVEG